MIRLADGQSLPGVPDDLVHPVAIEVWTTAVAELWPRGLRAADMPAIRMMANQAARAWDAETGIRDLGMMVRGPKGVMVNPLVKVERDASAAYARLAAQFGLDIASRLRLGLMQLAGHSLAEALTDDLERG